MTSISDNTLCVASELAEVQFARYASDDMLHVRCSDPYTTNWW